MDLLGAHTDRHMPQLIDELLLDAEKDLDINQILSFIVTANPALQSELKLPLQSENHVESNEAEEDEVVKFIIKLFNIWVSGVEGQLWLNVDTRYMTPDLQSKIQSFTQLHNFPSPKRNIRLPEQFLKNLSCNIRKARQGTIEPLPGKPTDNPLYVNIERLARNQESFKAVNYAANEDSSRIIPLQQLINFTNFINAIKKASAQLNSFLVEQFSPKTSLAQTETPNKCSRFSLFSSCLGRDKEAKNETTKTRLLDTSSGNSSINSNKKLSLTAALDDYLAIRTDENEQYHLWGKVFSYFPFIASPFSLDEKKTAVAKLKYWKERELNPPLDAGKDTEQQFTDRDIAAIRDHRLGKLCNEYADQLPKALLEAESRKMNNIPQYPAKYSRVR